MRSGDPRSERVGAEGGYTLVVVIVMITVLNVAIATAAPLWSTVLQREREAELVFRGMQYAEAIRVFEARHGRQPLRLEELLKVKPRSIRQLWVDPMTGEPDWDLVYQDVRKIRGADARSALHPGNTRRAVEQRQQQYEQQQESTQELTGPDGKRLARGPIRGVKSRSTESSMRLFFERSQYSDWEFTVDLLTRVENAAKSVERGQRGNDRGSSLRLSIAGIGRPLPVPTPSGPGTGGGTGLEASDMELTDASGQPEGRGDRKPGDGG